MLSVPQFRHRIKRTLHVLGPKFDSEAAVNLLLGTAIQESGLRYMKQINGPALGFFQIEPDTYDDLMQTYFYRGLPDFPPSNSNRRKRRANYLGVVEQFESPIPTRLEQLEANIPYQIVIARFLYWRIPEKLPEADDIEGLAAYWKRYYNTYLGKGTVGSFVLNYREHVE